MQGDGRLRKEAAGRTGGRGPNPMGVGGEDRGAGSGSGLGRWAPSRREATGTDEEQEVRPRGSWGPRTRGPAKSSHPGRDGSGGALNLHHRSRREAGEGCVGQESTPGREEAACVECGVYTCVCKHACGTRYKRVQIYTVCMCRGLCSWLCYRCGVTHMIHVHV